MKLSSFSLLPLFGKLRILHRFRLLHFWVFPLHLNDFVDKTLLHLDCIAARLDVHLNLIEFQFELVLERLVLLSRGLLHFLDAHTHILRELFQVFEQVLVKEVVDALQLLGHRRVHARFTSYLLFVVVVIVFVLFVRCLGGHQDEVTTGLLFKSLLSAALAQDLFVEVDQF